MGSIIKNRKLNNIEDGIKKVNKLYPQCGLNITRIYADSEFEPIQVEIYGICISIYWAFKK